MAFFKSYGEKTTFPLRWHSQPCIDGHESSDVLEGIVFEALVLAACTEGLLNKMSTEV